MSSKRRNWLWIIFGVCIVLIFIGIGAIVATTAWVRQNVNITDTTERSAEEEFAAVRARFSSRQPLLEMRNGRPAFTAGKAPDGSSAANIDRLHVLVWAPDESKLINLAIPFWLVRIKSGPITFSSYASGLDDEVINLKPEDIERHGPGVILDTTSPKGERVLLWAQ